MLFRSALAGVIVLGPRIGRFENGQIKAIPGHNLSLATIGAFVLWFGWFGFNPGSTMAADPNAIAHVAVTTNTAATAAIMSATFTSWILMGKPDLGMTLNGCLAGLVAITAPCAFVGIGSSLVIGIIAGVIVVLSVMMFDRLRLDDPVGALSVHLVNGVFGTICVGLFAQDKFSPGTTGDGLFFGGGFKLLGAQLTAVGSVAVFVFFVSFGVWKLLKATMGIRVSREEELRGLDIGEHGNEAYAGFQIFTTE